MFGTLKLSLNENIVAFFGWVTVLATFSKIWANFFPNLLVTLATAVGRKSANLQRLRFYQIKH